MVQMQLKGKGEKDVNVKYLLTKECLGLKDEAPGLEIIGALYTPNGIAHTHRFCGCRWPIGTTRGSKVQQLVHWQHPWIHSLPEAVQWEHSIQHPGECTEVPPTAPPPPSPIPAAAHPQHYLEPPAGNLRGTHNRVKLPRKCKKHWTCRRAPRPHPMQANKVHAYGLLHSVLVKEANSCFQNCSSD